MPLAFSFAGKPVGPANLTPWPGLVGKYQEIQHPSGSEKARMLFFLLVNNCWHVNIYEQEKIHAELSSA